MRKGHSVTGLNVIGRDGHHLGKVLDLVFDHGADQCLGLVLREKDLFGLIRSQIVNWDSIRSFGKDAVMVDDENALTEPKGRILTIMQRGNHLAGTKIYTDDGALLGSFGDVYLDESSGRVLGYEVSGGFFADTISGKRYMPLPEERTVGDDAFIVPAATAAQMKQQAHNEPGGVQGALAAAGETISGAYGSAKEHVTGATSSVSDAVSAQVGHLGQSAEEAALGKQAGTEVFAANGSTMLAPGMIITREVMARARLAGKEKEVIASAGIGSASKHAQNLADTTQGVAVSAVPD